MRLLDYESAYALWLATPGMGLSVADSREGIQILLDRNPDLSLVAEFEHGIVGTLLASHDGRRGYLHHLAVAVDFRSRGIARRLVERVLSRFQEFGIHRCNLLVFSDNERGRAFWKHLGFRERGELLMLTRDL